MARSGRKRKPKLELVEAGPRSEASVPIKVDEVPPGLPKAGQQFWRAMAPELRRLGLLDIKDMPAFYMACLSWGLACNAAVILEKEGYTVAGTHGTEKKHPALTMLNEQMSQFRQYLTEFGLSPAAIQRVKALPERELDDMEKLLSG